MITALLLTCALAATCDEIQIGAITVSSDQPPAAVVERYDDFNADFMMVWEAHEAAYWAPHDVVAWVDGEGRTVDVTPEGRVRTNDSLAANVIAVQVGDEPRRRDEVPGADLRNQFPVPAHTNFSYWAPLARDRWPDQETPHILAAYSDADRLSVSDYLHTPAHLDVLLLYRRHCLRYGMECWTYLNAYDGQETDGHTQTASDLRWTANVALTLGYDGVIWWAYNIYPRPEFPENHVGAVSHGGALLHDLETWDETPYWQIVADINATLHTQSAALDGHPSTAVTVRRDLITGEFGLHHRIVMNNTHAYRGNETVIEIPVPENWVAIGDPVLLPGAAVVLRLALLDAVR